MIAITVCMSLICLIGAEFVFRFQAVKSETIESTGADPDDVNRPYTDEEISAISSSMEHEPYGKVRDVVSTETSGLAIMEHGVAAIDAETLKTRWFYAAPDAEISAAPTPIDESDIHNKQKVVVAFKVGSLLGPRTKIVTLDAETGEVLYEQSISGDISPQDRIRWLTSDVRIEISQDSPQESLEAYSLATGEQVWDYTLPKGCSSDFSDPKSHVVTATQDLALVSYNCPKKQTSSVQALNGNSGDIFWRRSWDSSSLPSLFYVGWLDSSQGKDSSAASTVVNASDQDFSMIDASDGEDLQMQPWSRVPKLDDYIPAPVSDTHAPDRILVGDATVIQRTVSLAVAHRLVEERVLSVGDFEGTGLLVEDTEGEEMLPSHFLQWGPFRRGAVDILVSFLDKKLKADV
ncbi:hypothetical protein GCM10009799_50990 [Nocardiopsis rhodophaea]|uniref:Uncharacterized protein n=1 Tax=Nocardiopsis rhodophaea TaxID=280238 RepID=A0ABN2TPF3_9ACTN